MRKTLANLPLSEKASEAVMRFRKVGKPIRFKSTFKGKKVKVLLAHHSQKPKAFPAKMMEGVDVILCCHPQALPEEQKRFHVTSLCQEEWAGKLDFFFLGDELEVFLNPEHRL